MRTEWILSSLFVVLTISEVVFAATPDFSSSNSQQPSNDENRKLADEIRAKYLLSRYLFSPYPNENQDGREASLGSDGIPFRPVRRLGSEFLGKRSVLPNNEDPSEGLTFEKRRVMGSEFLGKKRRLGSEFLGKRSQAMIKPEVEQENGDFKLCVEDGQEPGFETSMYMKRARLGSEFLGKRAGVPLSTGGDAERGRLMASLRSFDAFGSPWVSSFKPRQQQLFENKRRMMGSEFLGK